MKSRGGGHDAVDAKSREDKIAEAINKCNQDQCTPGELKPK